MYVLCEQTVGHEGHRSRQGADTLTPRHHANRRSRQPTGSMINFIAIHVRTYLVRMVKYPHACTVHALYMEFSYLYSTPEVRLLVLSLTTCPAPWAPHANPSNQGEVRSHGV